MDYIKISDTEMTITKQVTQKISLDNLLAQKNQIEQDMAPFGFIVDGTDETSFVDVDGDRWHLDEYGDRQAEFSYMWDYM